MLQPIFTADFVRLECQTLASFLACLLISYMTQQGLQETRTPQKQRSSPGVHTAWHNFQRFHKLPTGEQFVTLFGTNQSMLEALLLKRKVMGPSWLALQKPVRVATQSQVQLCTKASHS